MLHQLLRFAIFCFIALGAVTLASAGSPPFTGPDDAKDNWPRFRGPDANPVSDNANLPDRWSKTENVEWVAEVSGVGWSSPIVWGNRVFLTSATSDTPFKQPSLGTDFSNDYIAEMREAGVDAEEIGKRLFDRDRELPHELVVRLMVHCYDLESGEKLWERKVYEGNPPHGRHRKNSWASETPVTDGERVYAYFTYHGLFAFDLDGNPAWTAPIAPLPTVRDFGPGASPALHGNRIFVLNDNEEQGFLAAFDTTTGKEVWRENREIRARRKTGWSTPFIWENPNRTEVVTLGPGRLISYKPEGGELWSMNGVSGAIQSPFSWDGMLYVASGASGGKNNPLLAIRPGAAGDITAPEGTETNDYIAWREDRAGGTYLPTPLVYDGALYVLHSKGFFARHDPKTGKQVFKARVAPGASAFTSSPWAYNGKIFAIGELGNTYVIEAGDEFKMTHVNSLDDWTLASPAIVGDRLLIRTQSRLYSIRKE